MNTKKAKSKGPVILLYGSFDDWFLEGIMTLGYNYKISNLSNLKNVKGKFDIVMFGWDAKQTIGRVLSEVKAVPVIMRGVKGFTDYDPQKEKGNSFKYKKNTSFHQLEALIKAVECFKYPYDWKNVKQACNDTLKYKVLS
jgi:hypothetical protein